MADDARPSTALERPALASVLATVTDRPVGHWIAELRSPAFRAAWDIERYGGGLHLCWHVETDFGRKTTARRSALLTITDPAEALEALIARGVLPPSFAGDALRWFWCDRCNGKGSGEWRNDVAIRCAAGAEKRGCGGRHWPNPRTILDLLAWASLGADAITRAEQLAREAATRLRPWGVRPPVETATTPDGLCVECDAPWRVVWKVTHQRHVILVGGKPREHVRGWPITANDPTDDQDVDAAWLWLHAQARRGGDPHPWWAAHVAAWPTDAPPCPHEPVLSILRAGIGFDAIDGDALVLVCPPLGGSNG